MYIRYHGHACFEIGNGKRIVFDPHDGISIGLPKPDLSANVVFITHEHFDHNAVHVVKGNFSTVREAKSGTVDGIRYESITQYHDDAMGKKRGEMRIYKVYIDGISFTHVGDLGHIPDRKGMDFLKGSDFLLLPVGSVYTINGDQAAEIVRTVRPKVAVPMHFYIPGSELKLEKIDRFLENFSPSIVKYFGKAREFKKDDLPKETEIWVFSQ